MSVYIYNPRPASETLPENRPASDKAQNPSSNNFVSKLSPLTSVLCEAPCVKCLIDVLPVRFLNLIEQRPDGCWQWLGSVRTTKYKRSRYRYGSYCNKLAHRMIYQAVFGKVPKGLEIDHLCHNTLCVNPEHLQAVTHQVNCERRFKSGPDPIPGSLNQRRKRARLVATSLLLVALLTPAPNQRAHMFGLAGIAQKFYAQLPLNFEPLVTGAESKTEVTSQSTEPAALPAVLAQLAEKYRPLVERVLARLSEAERKEVNPHLAQDIRQSWITVSYAQRMSDAFVQASYAVYGRHPDQIWPSIVADRKARLGKEYSSWYDSADMSRPDVPAKAPSSALPVSLSDSTKESA